MGSDHFLQVVYKILNDVHKFFLIESGLPLGWVNLNGQHLMLIILNLEQFKVQILKSRLWYRLDYLVHATVHTYHS